MEIDGKLTKHADTLEQMQVKVDLSMESLGKVQAEQSRAARSLKGPEPPPLTIPVRDGASIMGMPPGGRPPTPTSTVVAQHQVQQLGMPLTVQQQQPVVQRQPQLGMPKVTMPPPTPTSTTAESSGMRTENVVDEPKKGWMPKMDFPKFDGTDVRIWIDTCNTSFQFYNIKKVSRSRLQPCT